MAVFDRINNDDKMSKRILITSIPSWSQTGSNTWTTLFEFADPKDVANIYIQPEMPYSKVASRYFNIREHEVVKSVLKRSLQTGREIKVGERTAQKQVATDYKKDQKKHEFFLRHRWRVFMWMRELAWKLGCWKSKELDAFLEDYKPEVLCFAVENYPYFNRLNEYIIEKCQPKTVIGFLWDDNFTYKQHPYSWIFKIERFFQRRQTRRLVGKCTKILAISQKMKEECDPEFGVNSVVLTKPIFAKGDFVPFEVGNPVRMLYTGKLVIGRDETIAEVAKAIKEINKDGQKVILDVYTNTLLSDKMRQRIDIPGCCVLHDPVPQSEVFELQKQADVLLFAESMTDEDLTARLSFSTKLTDYFAAGKCVWGIGNSDLGPITYIKDEDAGFVSCNEKQITAVLQQIVEDPQVILEYAKKSFDCGRRNHDGNVIIDKLKNEVVEY